MTSTISRVGILKRYATLRDALATMTRQVEKDGDTLAAMANIEYHSSLLSTCEKVKYDIQEQLRSMETKLKEQEALLARYNEEVMRWINQITDDKWRYELIEKALSPSTGIPHGFMVSYINALIHNVNYFISQVFSYKLQLRSIPVENSIDFIFPVDLEGGVSVRDISRLSKGQREMVSIAWVFTILLQLKQLDKFSIFLDEVGGALDPHHSQKLIEFLRDMVDRQIISQIFVVNHEVLLSSGFSDSNVIVLNKDNVLLPENYNSNVTIN